MLIARKKALVGCNLVVDFGLQLGCKKNLWLVIFSPHDANMLDVFVPRARKEFDWI
jgi:hypothetical protein